MAKNVHTLSGVTLATEPVPETIKHLEAVLELARQGVVRSVAIVSVGEMPYCKVNYWWHSEGQGPDLYTGVNMLSATLLNRRLDNMEPAE